MQMTSFVINAECAAASLPSIVFVLPAINALLLENGFKIEALPQENATSEKLTANFGEYF
jgi:hypothetical protein